MSTICQDLHQFVNSLERFHYPYEPDATPADGIYVLFERGETGHGSDRIVRIGSHRGAHSVCPRYQCRALTVQWRPGALR